jgi:hypothetical protein
MAGNSLESLLAWMKDNSQMRGWDLIVALDGGRLNLGLQQDHIIRLSQGSDLGVISGSIEIPDTNIAHYLGGFRLAAPRLSFEDASLQSAKTTLKMAVIGGTQMMVETVQGQKKILSLTALDPLDGSHLVLDVPLGAQAHNVQLDLANSEDVLLTLFRTPNEQREAGKLFKAWFDALGNPQRVYRLGTLPDEGNALMNTRKIDVRTQRREIPAATSQATETSGAVLLFASMVDGGSGDFPGDDSGFRYLIPDDDGQLRYSATELFSRALIHRAAFGQAVLSVLADGEFEHFVDETGALAKLVARRGALQIAADSYRTLDFEYESDAFSLPATGGAVPLTVEFEQSQVVQRWQGTFTLSFRERPSGGTNWNPYTAVFNINLLHEFRLWADESGATAMEGELSTPYTHTQEVSVVSGLPEVEPDKLEQIKDFVANTVKRALLGQYSNTLTTSESETFVGGVDVVGGSTLHASHAALPFDQALFGQIKASGSSFSIVQQAPLLVAGEALQFTTEPVREGLQWTLESLSGDEGDPGRIDPQTGSYRAPPAHVMTGSFNRLLVIASDQGSGERSVTLVTVQANAITINPLIQLCYYGQKVELSAGQLDGSELSWSIKDPVPGESGRLEVSTEPGGDHTYVASPRVANKTYVLDEIEVANSEGDTRSAYVMVLQREPGVVVKPVENPSLPPGQIQLQALVNGNVFDAIWSLPLEGPGWIDEKGLYSDDMDAKERFVLIKALVDGGSFGEFEGHLILPLPLTDFAAAIRALAE